MTNFGQDGCNRVNKEQRRHLGLLLDSKVKHSKLECPKKLLKMGQE